MLAEYLKSKIKETMLALDTDKLDGIETYYRLQKNNKSLHITDEKLIPPQFKIVTETIDKPKLKEALKNGECIDGAEIITTTAIRRYQKGL